MHVKSEMQSFQLKDSTIELYASPDLFLPNTTTRLFSKAIEIRPGDVVFDIGDVKVIVDRESLQYIDGTEVDYVREGLNEAFKFRNPRATGECGCGESFSI